MLISVNKTRLNVELHKQDSSLPWLVFSNSLMTDLAIFDAQFESFKAHFNILRYDQRGHGSSDVTESALNFDILSEDLLGLMDYFDIEQCIFVGLSMGVPTGIAAFEKQTQRFSAMIFIDGQAASAATASEQWQARIDSAVESGLPSFAEATAQRWITPDNQAQKLANIIAMMSATPLEGFVASAKALKQYNYKHVLESLSVPCLLMAGEADGKMPETMQATAAALSSGEFQSIRGAGHVPCYEEPDQVNQAMHAFFEKLEAQR